MNQYNFNYPFKDAQVCVKEDITYIACYSRKGEWRLPKPHVLLVVTDFDISEMSGMKAMEEAFNPRKPGITKCYIFRGKINSHELDMSKPFNPSEALGDHVETQIIDRADPEETFIHRSYFGMTHEAQMKGNPGEGKDYGVSWLADDSGKKEILRYWTKGKDGSFYEMVSFKTP